LNLSCCRTVRKSASRVAVSLLESAACLKERGYRFPVVRKHLRTNAYREGWEFTIAGQTDLSHPGAISVARVVEMAAGAAPLLCREVLYWAGDSVALAVGLHRIHRVVVGRLRLKVVQMHAENCL
jgi:hypothetical protein